MYEPARLLTIEKQSWRTRETILDGPMRLLTTGATVLELPGRYFYNMSISAGGAREAANIRRNSAWEARDFDNMNNSVAGANDAVNNRRNSIGVATGIVFVLFVSPYNGKPNKVLNALRYMRFCEQGSYQTVYCHAASRLERLCKQTNLCRKNLSRIKKKKKKIIQTSLSPDPI